VQDEQNVNIFVWHSPNNLHVWSKDQPL